MALIPLEGSLNLESPAGADHIGCIFLGLTRAMVASGQWKRLHQGDGQSAYSTDEADLFTANGGLGYKTSGQYSTAVANSFSYRNAYIHLGELDADGNLTGRELFLRRYDSASDGFERYLIVGGSTTGITGTWSSTGVAGASGHRLMTYGGHSMSNDLAANSTAAGDMLQHSSVSSTPFNINGGSKPIRYSLFLNDGYSAENVAPFGVIAWSPNDALLMFGVFYDGLVQTAADDPHPCAWIVGKTNSFRAFSSSGAALIFNPTTSNQCMFAPATSGDIEYSALLRIIPPDSVTRPGGESISALGTTHGKQPLRPAEVYVDTSPNEYKGALESFRFPLNELTFPDRLHSDAVDPVELPHLALGAVTIRWLHGEDTFTGFTSTDSTDVFSVFEQASAPDTTDPTVELVSPEDDGEDVLLARDQTVTLDVGDETAIAYHAIFALYESIGLREIVFESDDGYGAEFENDKYTITPSSVDGKLRYEVIRTGGWPAAVRLRTRVVDTSGNVV